MKKLLSLLIVTIMIFSASFAHALNVKEAYKEFKSIHPDFINSLVEQGIKEATITSFIDDVYDYLLEIEKRTIITESNFEKNAMTAVLDVSSREKYYELQDALIILYPDAIKLAITEGKVASEFKPLVATVKRIYFADKNSGGGNEGGGGTGGSGGGNNSSDEKEDNPTEEVTPVAPPTYKFTDISSAHWAYESICHLADNFILNGYLDGTFKPESNITRAEFAKIIISATDALDASASSSFNDVDKDDWYYSYVATAYSKGYITGYPDGSFRPDDKITRADICTIVNRVLKASPSSNIEKFKDDNIIPAYAKDSVYALSSKGIINGFSDGTFSPVSFATRAQTAKIIYVAFFQDKE